MVQIDVPLAFAVGTYFADVAHRQLRTGSAEAYYRTFLATMLFLGVVFAWIPIFFLTNYFSWEVTHMWWHANAVSAYPLFIPVFVVVFFGVGVLGFLVGHRLVTTGHLLANRMIYLGVLAFSAVWVFAQTHRTFRVGTREEWLAGTSPLFYEDRTFLVMLIVTSLVFAAGLAAFSVFLHRRGQDTAPPQRSAAGPRAEPA